MDHRTRVLLDTYFLYFTDWQNTTLPPLPPQKIQCFDTHYLTV